MESRPSWARGLKLLYSRALSLLAWSRPSWARGLKPYLVRAHSRLLSRVPRGRVD